MTPEERKALIALSKQDTGEPQFNQMVKEVVEEKLLADAAKRS